MDDSNPHYFPRRPSRTSQALEPRRPQRRDEPRRPAPKIFSETQTTTPGACWQISTTDVLHVRLMYDGRPAGNGRSFRFDPADVGLLERALEQAPRAARLQNVGSIRFPWGGALDVGVGPGPAVLLRVRNADGAPTKCHVSLRGGQLTALSHACAELRNRGNVAATEGETE